MIVVAQNDVTNRAKLELALAQVTEMQSSMLGQVSLGMLQAIF